MSFVDKAIEAVDTDSQSNTEAPAPADTSSDSKIEAAPDLNLKTEVQDTQEAQAIMDLAKVGKFKINGQDMTFDELQKAMLRQQDYTKKTQELAAERKFIDNLQYDLQSVKKNPALAAQFKQIYPEKFHAYLAFAMSGSTPEQAVQAAQTGQQLPPEVLERIERQEQILNSMLDESRQGTTEALDSMFTSFEAEAQKKFKLADMTHVYGAVETYLTENGITSKDLMKNKAAAQKMFDEFTKRSHEAVKKRLDDYNRETIAQTKQVNAKAADIGRGGGTPTAPPIKAKMKDVADLMVNDLNS